MLRASSVSAETLSYDIYLTVCMHYYNTLGKRRKKWKKLGEKIEGWRVCTERYQLAILERFRLWLSTEHTGLFDNGSRETKLCKGTVQEGREWNWETSEFASLQPVFKFSYGHNNYRFLIIGWIVEVQGNRCCISFLALIFFCFAGKGGKNRKEFLVELSQTDR